MQSPAVERAKGQRTNGAKSSQQSQQQPSFPIPSLEEGAESLSVAAEGGQKSDAILESILQRGYVVDGIIGRGNTSSIWIGHFLPGRRQTLKSSSKISGCTGDVCSHGVALKTSLKAGLPALTFLRREMTIWRELEHPNIVRVFETFEIEQGCCIAMEPADAGDLFDHVQRLGSLIEFDAKRIFHQIVEAVQFLHAKDIAHRDLKCENVLMFKSGVAKLADFGFARICREPESGSKVLSETFCGSVPYAAPEILEGNPYNPMLSDVWSLGVMLYVMLYGCLPLNDNNLLELLKKAKEQDIFFPEEPDVTDAAVEIMLLMMEPDVLSRRPVREFQRNAWFQSNHEDSNDAGASRNPPSIIIQRKTRKNSFVYDFVTDGDTSATYGLKDECSGGESEDKEGIVKTIVSKSGDGSNTSNESAGDHVRDVASPDWGSFEWCRDYRRLPTSSTGSAGSAGSGGSSRSGTGVTDAGNATIVRH